MRRFLRGLRALRRGLDPKEPVRQAVTLEHHQIDARGHCFAKVASTKFLPGSAGRPEVAALRAAMLAELRANAPPGVTVVDAHEGGHVPGLFVRHVAETPELIEVRAAGQLDAIHGLAASADRQLRGRSLWAGRGARAGMLSQQHPAPRGKGSAATSHKRPPSPFRAIPNRRGRRCVLGENICSRNIARWTGGSSPYHECRANVPGE